MKFDSLLECFCAVFAGVIVSGFWLMHWFYPRYAFLFFSLFFFISLLFSARIIVVIDTFFISIRNISRENVGLTFGHLVSQARTRQSNAVVRLMKWFLTVFDLKDYI